MTSLEAVHNRTNRPKSVTLLAIGVLSIAGLNCLRLVDILERWSMLQKLLSFSPMWLAATSLFFILAGISIGYSLLTGKKWAKLLTEIGVIGYLLYYWIDRLIIGDPVVRASNTLFALSLSLIILVYTFWALSRRNSRYYFRRPE